MANEKKQDLPGEKKLLVPVSSVDLSKFTVKKAIDLDDIDDLFLEAAKIVIKCDRASASLLQRRLSLGYARCVRILDQLEAFGIVGGAIGARPRAVLVHSLTDLEKHLLPESISVEKSKPPSYHQPQLKVITKPPDNPWSKSLFQVLHNPLYLKESKPAIPLGYGKKQLILKSLNELGHLLVVGNVASQKEAALDTIFCSLLFKHSPEVINLIIIDNTRYFSIYNDLPNLLNPVIYEPNKVMAALTWVIDEVQKRLELLAQAKVRTLDHYNQKSASPLPKIVVLVNHLEAELQFAHTKLEKCLLELTSVSHRVGIHFILTLDHLRSKDLSIEIQGNIPHKLFFRLSSPSDIGQNHLPGVAKLLPGEAYLTSISANQPRLLQGIYTSEANVVALIKSITSKS